jgi:hypothetical protein
MTLELQNMYNKHCSERSDINEHLPTLYKYSKECESVLECGVRGVISSWACLKGIVENNKTVKKLTCCDLSRSENIDSLEKIAQNLGVQFTFLEKNDLEIDIDSVDLTFIDTWHIYGQLKRELKKLAPVTNKYIIMHDTTVDEFRGETLRNIDEFGSAALSYGWNVEMQMKSSGFSRDDIEKGLSYAINEFLSSNSSWKLKEKFTNNNGLTILERIK